MITVTNTETNETQTVETIEEAATIMQIDASELEWALEEFGECDTDTHHAEEA